MIYLDHNATTLVRPEAISAMTAALALPGNASSVHRAGQTARRLVSDARDTIAAAIGLPSGGQIIFTSGGTEANHLALRGAGRSVLRSAIEHDSVRAAMPEASVIPVDAKGVIDLDALERLLAGVAAPVLVSVMAANNETGIIQPMSDIVALAHRAGALVHCDAVQMIGRLPFDMADLGLDLVSLSAHKLGGPQGVGALAVAPGISLDPVQRGGGQEMGLRAGTENLPGIAGFGAAIVPAVAEVSRFAEIARLRDRLEATLLAAEPSAIIFGRECARLPNTICVALPGVDARTQVIALDLAGICVGAGSACSSGKVHTSHVLEAMRLDPELAGAAIRISLGGMTTIAEVDQCAAAWIDLARRVPRRRLAA